MIEPQTVTSPHLYAEPKVEEPKVEEEDWIAKLQGDKNDS